MSQAVFEDYEGLTLRVPALGRLKRSRLLPGVAMTSSVLVGLCLLAVKPLHAPVQPPAAAKLAHKSVDPFGGLASSSNLLRLDSVSPEEENQFAALAAAPVKPASATTASSDFVGGPYGDMGDLQAHVTWGSLASRPHMGVVFDEQPAAPPVPPNDSEIVTVEPSASPLASAPMPPRRPTDLASLAPERVAPAAPTSSAPAAPESKSSGFDVGGFFGHMFSGSSAPTNAAPNSNRSVAYASPTTTNTTTVNRSTARDNPILRAFMPSTPPGVMSRYDGYTAVYDIAARTVYLPDGTRLEAHSGLGQYKDDPRHVSTPARGATPPATYELTLRESLFHGVQALRLTPVGSGEQYGRNGFLAHPYMLGPDGDSNGCVSFRDYDAFLQAYHAGKVKKLVVVSNI